VCDIKHKLPYFMLTSINRQLMLYTSMQQAAMDTMWL